jgi:hypothetical protein
LNSDIRNLFGGLGLPFVVKTFLSLFFLAGAVQSGADSTINPNHASAWGGNIGWTNWRPDQANGAQIGEFVCAGYIYSANAGWINLGNGRPANGVRYQNQSATDFGVNHDQLGNLTGLAYGANIGWINFETNGAPRLDLQTGKLSGSVFFSRQILFRPDSTRITMAFPIPGNSSIRKAFRYLLRRATTTTMGLPMLKNTWPIRTRKIQTII